MSDELPLRARKQALTGLASGGLPAPVTSTWATLKAVRAWNAGRGSWRRNHGWVGINKHTRKATA